MFYYLRLTVPQKLIATTDGDGVRWFHPVKMYETLSGFEPAVPRPWRKHSTTTLRSHGVLFFTLEGGAKPRSASRGRACNLRPFLASPPPNKPKGLSHRTSFHVFQLKSKNKAKKMCLLSSGIIKHKLDSV